MKNPKLITKPFAQNGQKNAIPENFSSSMESNQATWDTGFGQITMIPVAAGGLPPKGQDFNGIFNQISENVVYLSKGGRFKFSSDYAAAIEGYPKGAILQSDDEKKEYQSIIDNNKVNFNTATQAQINAAWKLFSTDDMLQQLAGKQPAGNYALKGDSYTKVESDTKFQPKGNYAPAGNYQPAGDYATNTALNNGLALKFDTSGGDISGGLNVKTNFSAIKLTRTNNSSSHYLGFYNTDNSLRAYIGCEGDVNTLTILNNSSKKALELRQDGAIRYGGSDIMLSSDYDTDYNNCLRKANQPLLSDCKVGIPLPWPQATAPAGYLICNGQSFNKTTYPLLAQAYPNGILPDLRGEFIRGLDAGRNIDSGRTALSAQGDAIRNITGSFNPGVRFDEIDAKGVFSSERNNSHEYNTQQTGAVVKFNAEDVVPTANENRPRNIAFLYIVRAA